MIKVKPSRFLIYGLIDPRTRCLRYIGKTHKRRELRLKEHIEAAESGETSYVYSWIRELLASGFAPEIFVLERVLGNCSWENAERKQIKYWKNPNEIVFPYTHLPQTPKSVPTTINCVKLTNIHEGGAIAHPERCAQPNLFR